MFDSHDARSLGINEQIHELMRPGPFPFARDSNYIEYSSTECLVRVVRHVYYIRAIQSQLRGESFQGYPSSESQNIILEYAWRVSDPQKQKQEYNLPGQIYRLAVAQEMMRQCDDIVAMINSPLMAKTLWNHPEFRLYNAAQGGIRDEVVEERENAKQLVWREGLSLQAYVNYRFGLQSSENQQAVTVLGCNEPLIFKVVVHGGSERRFPARLWMGPGPMLMRDYRHVYHSVEQVYTLVAIVWKKANGQAPEVKVLTPLETRQRGDFRFNDSPGSACVLFYAKFNVSEISPGGRVEELLLPHDPMDVETEWTDALVNVFVGTGGNRSGHSNNSPPDQFGSPVTPLSAVVSRSPEPSLDTRPSKRSKRS